MHEPGGLPDLFQARTPAFRVRPATIRNKKWPRWPRPGERGNPRYGCNVNGPMANTLCVGTLNVRGINNKLKRRVLYNYLRKHKIDVACLQETYINNNTIHDIQKEWRGNIFQIQGTNRSNGLVILTSSKIMHEEMEIVEKTDRILIIKLKISNVVYTFVNCYAPNTTTDKVNFLHQLQDEIQEIETDS